MDLISLHRHVLPFSPFKMALKFEIWNIREESEKMYS